VTGVIRDKKTGRIIVHKATRQSVMLGATFAGLGLLTIGGIFFMDNRGVEFGKAALAALEDFRKLFLEPRMVHFTIWEALYAVAETLSLAALTTAFGGIVALALGVFAARNLTNARVSNAIKAAVAVVRAVPTVLWVLIFAIGAGLGSVAAVIGMSFHTVGYLLKAFSESFEELDEGVIEALRASGANWLQIVFQAVLPSSVTYLLSWTFIRFEINFVTAVAMGAAAGAGGIGFDLYMASGHYFNIREVGFISYLILAVAAGLEILAMRLKDTQRIAI
jgi:phosphonate transport system permease protein